jgi:sigma-E factor negative regulatory protein RseA
MNQCVERLSFDLNVRDAAMNAAQQYTQFDPEGESAAWLSALADGEATMAELDVLLGNGSESAQLHGRWHRYQVTSEALRGDLPSAASRSPQAFLAGVMAGLPELNEAPLQLETVPSIVHVRSPAANDAVVRWKLVAGVASVAAVMAVSWGVLRTSPGAVDGGSVAGAQLASATLEAQKPLVLSEPVAVKTQQGTLIRDARLEQLLAEHRQYGGASALQMPAGFLRDATYEAAPQR